MNVYVGSYGKYAEGNLHGAWVNIEEFISYEEFLSHCKEIHKDEEDPEFMFQDWENIPDGLISESWIHKGLFEVELDEDDLLLVIDYAEVWSISLRNADLQELFEKAMDNRFSSRDGFEDRALEAFLGSIGVPGHLSPYICAEKVVNAAKRDYIFGNTWVYYNH